MFCINKVFGVLVLVVFVTAIQGCAVQTRAQFGGKEYVRLDDFESRTRKVIKLDVPDADRDYYASMIESFGVVDVADKDNDNYDYVISFDYFKMPDENFAFGEGVSKIFSLGMLNLCLAYPCSFREQVAVGFKIYNRKGEKIAMYTPYRGEEFFRIKNRQEYSLVYYYKYNLIASFLTPAPAPFGLTKKRYLNDLYYKLWGRVVDDLHRNGHI